MREWHKTPFGTLGAEGKAIRPPTIARWTLRCLFELAHGEGITVWDVHERIDSEMFDVEDIPKCPLHFPTVPAIVIDFKRSWPAVRWQFAVGLGLHYHLATFEGGVNSYRNREAEAYQRAELWANNFLATFAAKWCLTGRKLEDNAPGAFRGEICSLEDATAITRPRVPLKRQKPEQPMWPKQQSRPGSCKGTRSDGKPCRGGRSPGSLFCRHHQNTKLPTLEDIISEEMRRASGE